VADVSKLGRKRVVLPSEVWPVFKFMDICHKFRISCGDYNPHSPQKASALSAIHAENEVCNLRKGGGSKGHHEPLIDLALFNQVQDQLAGKAKAPARTGLHQDFTLRGLVCCAECGQAYRACWSTGRGGVRHAYYLCQNKDCTDGYGKSIRRDVLEGDFEALLKTLTPSPALYALASALFRDLWDARMASSAQSAKHLRQEEARITRQIEHLIERILKADTSSLVSAYEAKVRSLEEERADIAHQIANCGRTTTDFDTTHRTAMGFLENPYKLWTSEKFEDRRAVVKLTFAGPLSYQRGQGFRTAETSLPFNIFKELEASEESESGMVPTAGLEPARGVNPEGF
jgi:site-specific DNA recombinase